MPREARKIQKDEAKTSFSPQIDILPEIAPLITPIFVFNVLAECRTQRKTVKPTLFFLDRKKSLSSWSESSESRTCLHARKLTI